MWTKCGHSKKYLYIFIHEHSKTKIYEFFNFTYRLNITTTCRYFFTTLKISKKIFARFVGGVGASDFFNGFSRSTVFFRATI